MDRIPTISLIIENLLYDDLIIFKNISNRINEIVNEEICSRYRRGIDQIIQQFTGTLNDNFFLYGEKIDRVLDGYDSIFLKKLNKEYDIIYISLYKPQNAFFYLSNIFKDFEDLPCIHARTSFFSKHSIYIKDCCIEDNNSINALKKYFIFFQNSKIKIYKRQNIYGSITMDFYLFLIYLYNIQVSSLYEPISCFELNKYPKKKNTIIFKIYNNAFMEESYKYYLKQRLYELYRLLFTKSFNICRFLNIQDSLSSKNLTPRMYLKIKFKEEKTGHVISLPDHYIYSFNKSETLYIEIYQKTNPHDRHWIESVGDQYIDLDSRKISISTDIYKYQTNKLYADSIDTISLDETIIIPFSHIYKEEIIRMYHICPLIVFYKRSVILLPHIEFYSFENDKLTINTIDYFEDYHSFHSEYDMYKKGDFFYSYLSIGKHFRLSPIHKNLNNIKFRMSWDTIDPLRKKIYLRKSKLLQSRDNNKDEMINFFVKDNLQNIVITIQYTILYILMHDKYKYIIKNKNTILYFLTEKYGISTKNRFKLYMKITTYLDLFDTNIASFIDYIRTLLLDSMNISIISNNGPVDICKINLDHNYFKILVLHSSDHPLHNLSRFICSEVCASFRYISKQIKKKDI